MSSSSGSSFLTAHESRRSIYPGMQARVSDADESETSRRPRRGAFPGILESDHEAEESYSPKDPPTQSAGTYSQMSGPRDSNAQYSHNTTNDSRSIPSQASMSDYSLSPRDSISNRGSRPSDRSNYDQHSRAPRSHSNIPHHHPRFASDDDDDYSPPRNLVYLPKVRISKPLNARMTMTNTVFVSHTPLIISNHNSSVMMTMMMMRKKNSTKDSTSLLPSPAASKQYDAAPAKIPSRHGPRAVG